MSPDIPTARGKESWGRAGWLPWLLMLMGLAVLLATLALALVGADSEEPEAAGAAAGSSARWSDPTWTRGTDFGRSVGPVRSTTH